MLSGCASCINSHLLNTTVSSVANPGFFEKKSYLLLPGPNSDIACPKKLGDCPAYIHEILRQQGFVRAAGYESAGILIFYSFRIGKPLVINYGFSVPQNGWNGVGSPKYMLSLGAKKSGSGSNRLEYFNSDGGGGRLRPPAGTLPLHDCLLSLRAYDYEAYKTEKKLRTVWITTARCLGPADNAQSVFLALMDRAAPYIAQNAARRDAAFFSKFEK
jgi:hypothetical protein